MHIGLLRYGSLVLLLAAAGLSGAVRSATEPEVAPYTRAGADTCLNCHDDGVALGIFKNVHGARGDNQTPFGHGQLQCEACHGPGGNHAKRPPRGQARAPIIQFGSNGPTPVAVQNGMCSSCHKVDLGAAWHAGPHADGIACADCHSSHTARDPVLLLSAQLDTCGTCHRLPRVEHRRAFSHPLAQGKMACTSCHAVHRSAGEHALIRNTVNETCYGCHADKRGPFLWEHAPVAEDCTLCHRPHGSSNPGMLTLRGPMLCQSCHSEAGHPSLAPASSQSLPGGARAQFVLGMNCMNCHSQVHGSNHPSGSRLMR